DAAPAGSHPRARGRGTAGTRSSAARLSRPARARRHRRSQTRATSSRAPWPRMRRAFPPRRRPPQAFPRERRHSTAAPWFRASEIPSKIDVHDEIRRCADRQILVDRQFDNAAFAEVPPATDRDLNPRIPYLPQTGLVQRAVHLELRLDAPARPRTNAAPEETEEPRPAGVVLDDVGRPEQQSADAPVVRAGTV